MCLADLESKRDLRCQKPATRLVRNSSVLIEHLGGAMSRVAEGHTAFPHRSAPYHVVIMPMWSDPAESDMHMGWADALWRAIQPSSTGGVHVNCLGNEGPARVQTAYGSNNPGMGGDHTS
jgi:hypothetical protein